MPLTDTDRLQMTNLALSRYNVLNGGSTPPEPTGEHCVRWIDYDGTVLKEEWLNTGESATPPSIPIHNRLTFDGWNYTLSGYSNITHDLDIGAMYHPTSGNTELDILLNERSGLYIDLVLKNSIEAQDITVYWGDGTNTSLTGAANYLFTFTHTYPSFGNYTISIECNKNYYLGGTGNTLSDSLFKHYNPSTGAGQDNKLVQALLATNCVAGLMSFCFSLKHISLPLNYFSLNDHIMLRRCISLLHVTIPMNVEKIKNNSFEDCYSLESISIPNNPFSFDTYAFNNCFNLKKVIFPEFFKSEFDLYKKIPNNCFANCTSLLKVYMPQNTIGVGSNSFSSCFNIAEIELSNSIRTIGSGAFSSCVKLKDINIPDDVNNIGSSAFQQCNSLKELTIPSGVTILNDNLFYGCYNLEKVTILGVVSSIGYAVFNYCYGLKDIIIPEGLSSIGMSAFLRCHNIRTLTIPSSVTSINAQAFMYCYNLKELILLSIIPPTITNTNVLGGIPTGYIIKVPAESLNAYKTASYWNYYANYMEAI